MPCYDHELPWQARKAASEYPFIHRFKIHTSSGPGIDVRNAIGSRQNTEPKSSGFHRPGAWLAFDRDKRLVTSSRHFRWVVVPIDLGRPIEHDDAMERGGPDILRFTRRHNHSVRNDRPSSLNHFWGSRLVRMAVESDWERDHTTARTWDI